MMNPVKIFAIILLLAASHTISAQSDSTSVFLRLKGGYTDSGSSNGVASLGAVDATTTEWDLGVSLGWLIGKWEIGFGAEYRKQKAETSSTIYFPSQWIAIEQTETDINLYLAKLYAAYHLRLFNRLYFIPDLAFYFGKGSGEQEYLTAYAKQFPTNGLFEEETTPSTGLIGGTSDIPSYNYLALKLAPAFCFFITERFALNLETGSFQFSMTDNDWDNRQWVANINPSYWKLGVMFKF